jgi:hypothetical protein
MDHYAMSVLGLRIAIVSSQGRKTDISAWSSTYIDCPVAGDPVEIPYRSDQGVLIAYEDDIVETFVRMYIADTLKYPPVYSLFRKPERACRGRTRIHTDIHLMEQISLTFGKHLES